MSVTPKSLQKQHINFLSDGMEKQEIEQLYTLLVGSVGVT